MPDSMDSGGFPKYLDAALQDLYRMQYGGIGMVLIENEGRAAKDRKAPEQTVELMDMVLREMVPSIHVPYLIAVLPCDYEASFDLAQQFNASGIWMDTLVDKASPLYTESDVVIDLDPGEVVKNKGGLKLFTEVQARNFYQMLENRPLEESVEQARKYADAICVVGESGPPSLGLVKRARGLVGEGYMLGVAGKLNDANINPYIGIADFGVFFSHLRRDGQYANPVSLTRVTELMQKVGN